MNTYLIAKIPWDVDEATDLLNHFYEEGYDFHTTYGDAVIFAVFKLRPTIDEFKLWEREETVAEWEREETVAEPQPDGFEVWVSTAGHRSEGTGIEGKDLL